MEEEKRDKTPDFREINDEDSDQSIDSASFSMSELKELSTVEIRVRLQAKCNIMGDPELLPESK